MTEFHSLASLPDIPDNVTIPQFIFGHPHEHRCKRPENVPWMIDDVTGKTVMFDEIKSRTYGLANGMSVKYGMGGNDVVVIFSRNHVDWLIAFWATHTLGSVVSGANPGYSSSELLYQIQLAEGSTLFVHPDSLDTALEAARQAGISNDRIVLFNPTGDEANHFRGHITVSGLIQLGLNSKKNFSEILLKPGEGKTRLALLSFSSGTTGKPKAVAIAHYALIANVIQMAAHNKVNEDYAPWPDRRFRPGDVAIGVLPLYHIYGLVVNTHLLFFCGMAVVVVPKFQFEDMLKSIVKYRITHLMLVPPQAILLCKHPAARQYDLSAIRCIMTGAAPLTEEVNQRLFELFPQAHIGQGYGMTESCTVSTMWPVDKKRGTSGSSGTIVPGITMKVVKEDGTQCSYEEEGELYCKSPSNALGYYKNEAATRETFVDGWLRTGDVAKVNRNSEVWILDRLKEIMKIKGFQVAPAEVEGCILDHQDVDDVCVVGIPDDYSGELPLAFVKLSSSAVAEVKKDASSSSAIKSSIMKHVANNKVNYKHLAAVEFVDLIPKNPSGKLLRRLLREEAKLIRSKAKL